jgi:hypothetical protein
MLLQITRMRFFQTRDRASCFAISLVLLASLNSAAATKPTPSAELERGYAQMYNLQFPAAHATFRAYQQAHPDDPMGYVSNAAAYLFSEFDRLHILESDLFVDDRKFDNRSKLTPDASLKQQFNAELQAGAAAAARALAKQPDDRNALFAQVLANGLQSDYTALIEKRNFASLQYVKNGRMQAEKLLAIDPTYYDAYLAIGVENYLLGINSAPVRWMLRMAGAQTNKEEGLEKLRLTASKGHYLAPFARLLLAVAALRDKDPQTARTLLAGLAKDYPGNQLYVAELARIQ